MLHIYTVQSLGYYHCPEYKNYAEAKLVLAGLVVDSLNSARRKSPQATKHKLGKDSYSITLGADRNSALWAVHTIL
jgi:hypothetical protein